MEDAQKTKCPLCDKEMLDVCLKRHLAAHDKNRPRFTCEICKLSCSTNYNLIAHVKTHNETRERFVCDQCEKTLLSLKDLKKHKETHIENRKPTFHCHCGASYLSKGALSTHQKTKHDPTIQKSFICDVCKAAFLSQGSLNHHKRQVHGDDIFECPSCDYKCSTKGRLDQHQLIHISGKRKYTCTVEGCNRSFHYQNELNSHVIDHTTPKQKKYHCDIAGCDKSYTSKNGLDDHKLTHDGKRNYSCTWENCIESFVTPGLLRGHMLRHTRPFKCTWIGCDEAFPSNLLLREHLNIHEGLTPHACTWPGCKKGFASQSTMLNHLAQHSKGDRHKCSWEGCLYACFTKTQIDAHYRTHTGEKPYVCNHDSCRQAFTTSQGLIEHQRRYHLGKCASCLLAGHALQTAALIHPRFAKQGLCLPCGQHKYGHEAAYRVEYWLANYINKRFAGHPNIRAIIFDKMDPDDDRCSKFRPDIRILTHSCGDAIIECDENSHKDYMCTMADLQASWSDLQIKKQDHVVRKTIKEHSRMSEIVTTGTIDQTVAWRWNPDRYLDENEVAFNADQIDDGNGNPISIDPIEARTQRAEVLCNEIQEWLDGKWDMSKLPFIYVVYLFYDGPLRQESLVPVDGDEYKTWHEQLKSKIQT